MRAAPRIVTRAQTLLDDTRTLRATPSTNDVPQQRPCSWAVAGSDVSSYRILFVARRVWRAVVDRHRHGDALVPARFDADVRELRSARHPGALSRMSRDQGESA